MMKLNINLTTALLAVFVAACAAQSPSTRNEPVSPIGWRPVADGLLLVETAYLVPINYDDTARNRETDKTGHTILQNWSVALRDDVTPVSLGSRTGAVFLRYGLSVAPCFLWECLTSGRPVRLTGQSRKELFVISASSWNEATGSGSKPSWQWCVFQRRSLAWFQAPCTKQWLTVGVKAN